MSKKEISSKNTRSNRTGRLYFTGFSMGLADLVPGVSGGTIALLYGIYDELIYSIKIITGKFPKKVLQGEFKEAFKLIPFKFLVPLFLGIITAAAGFVNLFSFLLVRYPVFVWSLFFGLVLFSSYLVSKRIREWNLNRYLLLFFGLMITYFLIGFASTEVNPTGANIFGAGAIASSALILPGISGSLMLVLLGQYQNVIDSAAGLDIYLLSFFILGIIIGLSIFSRILSWMLTNYHNGTIAFLVGVMLGSLRRIWPWQIESADHIFVNTLPKLEIELLFSLILMIVGGCIVWRLEKIGIAEEHDDIDDEKFQKQFGTQRN